MSAARLWRRHTPANTPFNLIMHERPAVSIVGRFCLFLRNPLNDS